LTTGTNRYTCRRGKTLPVDSGARADRLVLGKGLCRSGHIRFKESAMAKAYWVATYRSISNPEALAGYAKLAGPAIQAAGGRFLPRGTAPKAYEAGVVQRGV